MTASRGAQAQPGGQRRRHRVRHDGSGRCCSACSPGSRPPPCTSQGVSSTSARSRHRRLRGLLRAAWSGAASAKKRAAKEHAEAAGPKGEAKMAMWPSPGRCDSSHLACAPTRVLHARKARIRAAVPEARDPDLHRGTATVSAREEWAAAVALARILRGGARADHLRTDLLSRVVPRSAVHMLHHRQEGLEELERGGPSRTSDPTRSP